ncbi:MAG: motility protein A [Candidatus Binatia bacterium]
MFRNLALPGAVLFALALGAIFNPRFFDPLSLLITFGGAAAVTYFSFSEKQLRGLARAIHQLLKAPESTLATHVAELRRLSGLYRLEGLRGLENQEPYLKDGFLKYGVELLVDLHNREAIHARLEHRMLADLGEHEIHRQVLMTLGKLLPSFGLIGTLIGMVLLLGNLSTQDSQTLPAALGLAVLTTLYGAVSANVIVAPLLARLQSAAVERETKMRLTKEWVMTIMHGNATALVGTSNGRQSFALNEHLRIPHWTSLGLPAQR